MIDQVIKKLRENANAANVVGMARYGIATDKALGIPLPVIRKLAKEYKKDHALALELWETGIHEARLLASMVDDPKQVTLAQMENWVKDFYSWDICDQTCGNLFDKTPFAYEMAMKWCKSDVEYVKRAGFAMMAELAVHDKKAGDDKFIPFFECMIAGSTDERNFVKKAVNWALRQIGKRNLNLYPMAIATAEKIKTMPGKAPKWIAADALKELVEKEKQGKIKGR